MRIFLRGDENDAFKLFTVLCKKVKRTGLKSEQISEKKTGNNAGVVYRIEADRLSEDSVKCVLEWLSSTTSAVLMQEPAELLNYEDRLRPSEMEIWQS